MSLVLGELSTILSADERPLEKGIKRGEGLLRDAKGRYVKVAKDAGEASGEATGGGFLGKIGPLLKSGAAAAATAAALALGAAFVQALDVEKAQDKLAAQLGASGEWSRELGAIAGRLYADAYGESLAEVNVALRGVIQDGVVMEDETTEQIERITAKVLDLASAFDQDLGQTTRAVGKLIETGLAKDAHEALDLLTRGFQEGADQAGDLLDTVSEYSTQWRNMGLDGATALGLIKQGLRAGARDADVVADTIKEFSIEAVAGGSRVQKGFKNLGLDADKMVAAFAKGGPAAASALDQVLDKLRGIEDPARRNAVAIELFGTKAEDMGDALYSLDPSSAVDALGKVGGAADRMGQTLNDNAATKIEAFKRQGMQKLTEFGGAAIGWFEKIANHPDTKEFLGKARQFLDENVIPALRRLWGWFKDKIMPVLVQMTRDHFARLQDALRGLQKRFDDNRDELEQFGRALRTAAEWIVKHVVPVVYAFYSKYLARLISVIGSVIEVISFWVRAFNLLKSTARAVADFVVSKYNWLVDRFNGLKKRLSFAGMFDGIRNAFRSAINWVIGKWNGLELRLPSIDTPLGSIGGWTVGTPNISFLKLGGIVPPTPGGRLVGVAEGGEAEAVAPLSKLTSMLRDAVRDVLAERGPGGRGITVEQLIVKAFSDRFSVAQVMDELAMHGVS